MAPRNELQNLLEEILGSRNVYFQPPANVQIQYPCIVYKRDSANTKFAGNTPYNFRQRYMVSVIDTHPDGDILTKIANLPLCTYNRYYTADHLHHDVFNLYF